jgi:glyoxylase-like metal-dependent hydrolase (beta-lactamase superfamily II)
VHEIYALSQGARAVDWSTRLYLHPAGEPTTSAYFFWILRGPSGPTLIDTGFTLRLAGVKGLAAQTLRERTGLFVAAGIDPAEVSTVILTHLHWDHFDLEGFLPRAVFWAQRREVEFWSGAGGRDPWLRRFISDCFSQDLEALRSSGRLVLVDGVAEPAAGIRLEWVGGHSPGIQIVVVETARGPFVIANDALTTYRNLRDWAPPAIHINGIPECLAAMARIRALAGGDESRLCPGHDGEILTRFPEVRPGVLRLA